MTVSSSFFMATATVFFFCPDRPVNQIEKYDTGVKAEGRTADTTKKLIVDDYPVPTKLFGRDIKENAREISSGTIHSSDMVWFSNDSLEQILVYELYTDDFRNASFHFLKNDIPPGLIKRMELIDRDGEPASEKAKEKYFKGFFKAAKKIRPAYFTTHKGFKLGDKKEKAISFYGKPGKVSLAAGIETCEWNF